MQRLSRLPQGPITKLGMTAEGILQTPGHAGDGDRAEAPGLAAPGWAKELTPTLKSSLPSSRL